MRKPT